jgi:hypothetical protein
MKAAEISKDGLVPYFRLGTDDVNKCIRTLQQSEQLFGPYRLFSSSEASEAEKLVLICEGLIFQFDKQILAKIEVYFDRVRGGVLELCGELVYPTHKVPKNKLPADLGEFKFEDEKLVKAVLTATKLGMK